jgi:hypothetical protein
VPLPLPLLFFETVIVVIISFIKGTALRRTFLKIGGIGKSRNTEKIRAFAGFQVRAP